MYPPLALIISSSLRKNDSHAARRWSVEIRFHSRWSADFKEYKRQYVLVQTLASKMDQMEKSMGFASGELKSHCCAEMKCGTFSLNQSWFTWALCEGTESCYSGPWSYIEVLTCPRLQGTFQNHFPVVSGINFDTGLQKHKWRMFI